jgi:hypothetical protein
MGRRKLGDIVTGRPDFGTRRGSQDHGAHFGHLGQIHFLEDLADHRFTQGVALDGIVHGDDGKLAVDIESGQGHAATRWLE